ncbi:MAG: isoprenylcysteine carboxylmethyltransferase family protein [Desulfobacteraceae bacterium]|nr:isoprenylcysteine carboxylmethyltransferase family protein [Desulfobacteraceae bacterium]
MSVCRIRLILWLILAGTTVVCGFITYLTLPINPFPLWLRVVGVAGMLLSHFPLKRTGRLLKRMGASEEWGCTTKLVTTDVYRCLRHPHHLSIGIFMTSLGLAMGHIWSFLLIAVPQWLWIFGFLFLVEEKELLKKFGEDYAEYRRKVPMLIGDPLCLLEVLSHPLNGP